MKRAVMLILPPLSLLLVGIGGWLAWRPLGPLLVGFLLWCDLTIAGITRHRRPKQ